MDRSYWLSQLWCHNDNISLPAPKRKSRTQFDHRVTLSIASKKLMKLMKLMKQATLMWRLHLNLFILLIYCVIIFLGVLTSNGKLLLKFWEKHLFGRKTLSEACAWKLNVKKFNLKMCLFLKQAVFSHASSSVSKANTSMLTCPKDSANDANV